jgi:hypothetical protein
MKSASKFQRVSAAVAAVAVSLSIVWSIAGYAYPDAPSSWFGQVAKKTSLPSRS